jgi:hypothetical protein
MACGHNPHATGYCPCEGGSGSVQQSIVPGMAVCTEKAMVCGVWIRQDLGPRDRSLVTIPVPVSKGQSARACPPAIQTIKGAEQTVLSELI